MCGRYVSPDEAAIERAWHVGRDNSYPLAGSATASQFATTRFNTSPTTDIPILCANPAGGMRIATARWGLIPVWWKNEAPPTFSFNARLEEAAGKPMWRHPLRHSRCLVPAEGWYEWEARERPDPKTGKPKVFKQPHYLRRRDRRLFCFAGLLSAWTTPEQDAPKLSCAILTRAALGPVAEVHDRMPVILDDRAFAQWLDTSRKTVEQVEQTIGEYALVEEFEHFSVSTAVNSSRSQGPQLIEPLGAGAVG